MTRAAPGPQVSAGRLRVDAARAIAKLREYQLVDRTAWVLEAIRAAVASGATAVSLDGDVNDVWLRWDGPAWPAEELPRLFDELVSPEPARASQHLRLLAAAVNSALGMRPAYVDVIAIAEGGAAKRVRYTPDVLEVVDTLDDAPLRALEVEDVPVPEGAPSPGMVVHLRRRISLETLGLLFFGDTPELALARRDAADLAVPLRVRDLVLGRAAPGQDVIRVPLGQDLAGWIALHDPADGKPGATLEIAEHGVVIARYSSDLVISSQTLEVPVRLYVDAPRMPTNASRSEVRLAGHPIPAAEARAKALVPALLAKLAEVLTTTPDDARHRAAALALIGVATSGAAWSWNLTNLTEALAPLANLPLLRSAVGEARPVTGPWLGVGIHDGDEPFTADLAPWLGHVLWVPPGDVAARVVRGASIDRRAIRRHARFARRQLRAQQKFQRHTRRAPRLTGDAETVKLRIGEPVPGSCVPDAAVAGLDGEVGIFIHDERSGVLALLLDGRDIEVLEHPSPIRFTAIVDNPRFTPDDGYRGVARDGELARVEAAVRGTVIRAAEVLATRIAEGKAGDRLLALATVRRAIALAHELGYPLDSSPLAACPAWGTPAGERVAVASLRGQRAIGVTAPGSGMIPPSGRVVLAVDHADRAVLGQLLGVPFVDYDVRHGSRAIDRAVELARALVRTTQVAMVIREAGLAAAIGPSPVAMISLGHAGVELSHQPYPYVLGPCAIAIDADAVIPNADWTGVHDDGAVLQRDVTPWERALLRAIVAAIAGGATPDLVVGQPPALGDLHGGLMLCSALTDPKHGGPDALLGADLVKQLRAAPIVKVLGGDRVSIDALCATHPGAIPFVPIDTLPIAGDAFRPVVGQPVVAHAIAALAGRTHEDGLRELTRRRDLQVRAIRRAAHLGKPALPLRLPADTPAQVEADDALVGVGRDELVIVVRVLGRELQRITRAHDLPLIAHLDVDEAAIDDAFGAVREEIAEQIVQSVRTAAAVLLTKIAHTAPTQLADDPRTLALLVAWLIQIGSEWETLLELRAAVAWPTVQGGRVATGAIRDGERVRVATWTGEWLGPLDDELPDDLDAPVLLVSAIADDPVREALSRLEPRPLEDVSDRVRGLQAQRRMARGLLPAPTIPGVNPALCRALASLGGDGRVLGPGEIALTADPSSMVYLHSGGALGAQTTLTGVSPPVQLAIERPELVSEVQVLGSVTEDARDRLTALVQPAAAALARELAREHPGEQLAPNIRHHLRRAVLRQWLSVDDVLEVLVLEDTDDRWWPWTALAEQTARFGNVWYTSADDRRVPLDESRIALRLTADEVGGATVLGYTLVNAAPELALDATARSNRARLPVPVLDLQFEDRALVIAQAPLAGDGLTSVRGVVAPLSPQMAKERRVRPHVAMHPFDPVNDPCAWPTLSVIDDARLTADRTWSVPVGDQVWKDAAQAIREASEHALRSLVPVSPYALASRWIGPEQFGGISPYPTATEQQIRGALWLIDPADRGVVVVHRAAGQSTLPIDGAPMAGRLYVHSTTPDGSEEVVQRMARRVYAVLLGDAQAKLDQATSLVTAHLARGLALGVLRSEAVPDARFACFRPVPLDARELAALLRATTSVDILDPGADGVGVVDDATALSRVVIVALGARASRPQPLPPAALPGLPPVHVPLDPPPRHPLAELAAAVERRLADAGVPYHVSIAPERDTPICKCERGGLLVLAAHDPTLWAIDARRAQGGVDGRAAVDALTAHVLTVLNRDLAEVNDVTEAIALARLLG